MENKAYKIVNGTAYRKDTPEDVIKILEFAMKNKERIRLFYGDTKTGKDWLQNFNTTGTIGRSTGQTKIPLLINNSRSQGGYAVLDNCIVKITIDKRTVYQNPKYHLPAMEIKEAGENLKIKGYFYSVFADGENIYNCKTLQQAENKIVFHKGIRNKAA